MTELDMPFILKKYVCEQDRLFNTPDTQTYTDSTESNHGIAVTFSRFTMLEY